MVLGKTMFGYGKEVAGPEYCRKSIAWGARGAILASQHVPYGCKSGSVTVPVLLGEAVELIDEVVPFLDEFPEKIEMWYNGTGVTYIHSVRLLNEILHEWLENPFKRLLAVDQKFCFIGPARVMFGHYKAVFVEFVFGEQVVEFEVQGHGEARLFRREHRSSETNCFVSSIEELDGLLDDWFRDTSKYPSLPHFVTLVEPAKSRFDNYVQLYKSHKRLRQFQKKKEESFNFWVKGIKGRKALDPPMVGKSKGGVMVVDRRSPGMKQRIAEESLGEIITQGSFWQKLFSRKPDPLEEIEEAEFGPPSQLTAIQRVCANIKGSMNKLKARREEKEKEMPASIRFSVMVSNYMAKKFSGWLIERYSRRISEYSMRVIGLDVLKPSISVETITSVTEIVVAVYDTYRVFSSKDLPMGTKINCFLHCLTGLGIIPRVRGVTIIGAVVNVIGKLSSGSESESSDVTVQAPGPALITTLSEALGQTRGSDWTDKLVKVARNVSASITIIKACKMVIDYLIRMATGKSKEFRKETQVIRLAFTYVEHLKSAYRALKGIQHIGVAGDFISRVKQDNHALRRMFLDGKVANFSEATQDLLARIDTAQDLVIHMSITNPIELVNQAGEGLILGLFGDSGIGKSLITSYLGFCVNEAYGKPTPSLNDCLYAMNTHQEYEEGHHNLHNTVVIDEFGQYTDTDYNNRIVSAIFALDNPVKAALNSAAVEDKGKHFALQKLTILTSNCGADLSEEQPFPLPPALLKQVHTPAAVYRRISGYRMIALKDREGHLIRTHPKTVCRGIFRYAEEHFPHIDISRFKRELEEPILEEEDPLYVRKCTDVLIQLVHAYRAEFGERILELIEDEYEKCWKFVPLRFVDRGPEGQYFAPCAPIGFKEFKKRVLHDIAVKQNAVGNALFNVAIKASKYAMEEGRECLGEEIRSLEADLNSLDQRRIPVLKQVFEYCKKNSLHLGIVAMVGMVLGGLGWKMLSSKIQNIVPQSRPEDESRSHHHAPKYNPRVTLGFRVPRRVQTRKYETQADEGRSDNCSLVRAPESACKPSLKVDLSRLVLTSQCDHSRCKRICGVFCVHVGSGKFVSPSHVLDAVCEQNLGLQVRLETRHGSFEREYLNAFDFISECAFLAESWHSNAGEAKNFPCDAMVVNGYGVFGPSLRTRLPRDHLKFFRTAEENCVRPTGTVCCVGQDSLSVERIPVMISEKTLLRLQLTTCFNGEISRGFHDIVCWRTSLSKKGACGSPYVSGNSIVGIHCAGSPKDLTLGFASVVDREMILEAVRCLDGAEPTEDTYEVQAGCLNQILHSLFQRQITYYHHHIRVVQPNKSVFVRNDDIVIRAEQNEGGMFRNADPRDLSVLKPVRRCVDGVWQWVSPIANGILELYPPEALARIQKLEVSEQAISALDELCSFPPLEIAGFSLEEAITGSTRNPRGLNLNSSVGIDKGNLLKQNPKSKVPKERWVTQNPNGKRRFLECKDRKIVWYGGFDDNPVVELLREMLYWAGSGLYQEEVIAHLEEGKLTPNEMEFLHCWLYSVCCKDERRSLKKVEEVNTRLFMVAPVASTILITMFFGPLMVNLQRAATSNFMQVGINPHSQQWGELVNYLKLEEWKILAGDYSKFDKRIPPQILRQALGLLVRWKGRGLTYKALDTYEKYLESLCDTLGISVPTLEQCEDFIIGKIAQGVYCLEDFWFVLSSVNPSGNKITVEINCTVNALLILDYLVTVAPDCVRKREFRIATYGDDQICTVPWSYTQVSMNGFADFLWEKYRITYTDPNKKTPVPPFIPFEELTYLKRRFVRRDDRWYAPLDMVSIENMLYWRRKTMSVEESLVLNFRAMAIELVHHGREVFEKVRNESLYLTAMDDRHFPTWEQAQTYFNSEEALLHAYRRTSCFEDFVLGRHELLDEE